MYLIMFESRPPAKSSNILYAMVLAVGIFFNNLLHYPLYLAACSNDNHLCKGDGCDVIQSDFSQKHFRQNHFFLPLCCWLVKSLHMSKASFVSLAGRRIVG